MLDESCLCHRVVGQDEVIVVTDAQCRDSTVTVTLLKSVHHDEWFPLGNQSLDILTLYHFSLFTFPLHLVLLDVVVQVGKGLNLLQVLHGNRDLVGELHQCDKVH